MMLTILLKILPIIRINIITRSGVKRRGSHGTTADSFAASSAPILAAVVRKIPCDIREETYPWRLLSSLLRSELVHKVLGIRLSAERVEIRPQGLHRETLVLPLAYCRVRSGHLPRIGIPELFDLLLRICSPLFIARATYSAGRQCRYGLSEVCATWRSVAALRATRRVLPECIDESGLRLIS